MVADMAQPQNIDLGASFNAANAAEGYFVPRRVLGLDPSLSAFGSCAMTERGADAPGDVLGGPRTIAGGRVAVEVWPDLSSPPAPGVDSVAARVGRYRAHAGAVMREHLDHFGPTLVVVEGYSYGSSTAGITLGEFGAILRDRLLAHSSVSTVAEVPPALVKKFAAGKGSASKTLVATSLVARYGVEPFSSDNQADAFALAAIGACLLGMMEPQNAAQREVLAKLDARALQGGTV